MSAHDEKHEEWLQQVATGELAPQEAERRLSGCGECQRALVDLRETLELLDDTARHERDVRETAASIEHAPGADRVASVIGELAGTAPVPAGVRWRPVLVGVGLLAVAALVFVVARTAFLGETVDPADDVPVYLGPGDDLACTAPLGTVARYDPFEWEGELPPDATFVVEILAEGANPVLATPILTSQHLTENRWNPTDAELERLPRAIDWTVRMVDPSGRRTIARAQGSASLR